MLRELHVASDLGTRQDAGRSGVKAVGTDGPGSPGREGQTSWDEIIKKWATVELVVHKGPREMKTSVATGPSEHPNWRRSGYDTVSHDWKVGEWTARGRRRQFGRDCWNATGHKDRTVSRPIPSTRCPIPSSDDSDWLTT